MRVTQHPQDDLLIVEALHRHGNNIQNNEPARAARAWEIATDIAHLHGLDVSDALSQVQEVSQSEPTFSFS